MIDEIFDRAYRAGRADLNLGIGRALGRIARAAAHSFKVLQRIEYDAPWAAESKGPGCI